MVVCVHIHNMTCTSTRVCVCVCVCVSTTVCNRNCLFHFVDQHMKFRKEIGADTILEDWTPPEVSDHGRPLNNLMSQVTTSCSSSSLPLSSLLPTQGFEEMFSRRVLW